MLLIRYKQLNSEKWPKLFSVLLATFKPLRIFDTQIIITHFKDSWAEYSIYLARINTINRLP